MIHVENFIYGVILIANIGERGSVLDVCGKGELFSWCATVTMCRTCQKPIDRDLQVKPSPCRVKAVGTVFHAISVYVLDVMRLEGEVVKKIIGLLFPEDDDALGILSFFCCMPALTPVFMDNGIAYRIVGAIIFFVMFFVGTREEIKPSIRLLIDYATLLVTCLLGYAVSGVWVYLIMIPGVLLLYVIVYLIADKGY